MVEVYAISILDGIITLDRVPQPLQEKVERKMEEYKHENLSSTVSANAHNLTIR